MVSSVALATGAILNQGCVTNNPPKSMVWYRAETSVDETTRDLAACQNEALVNGHAYSPIPADTFGHAIILGMFASSSENSRENQIVQTCMTAKGYSLVGTAETVMAKAENGDAASQFYLGCCYEGGYGVAKNSLEATKWFRKAAENNNADGQAALGYCYYIGEGVPKDYAEAVFWLQKAAVQGNAMAQSNLGAAYGDGYGVPINFVEAYKWRLLAAAQGEDSAKKAIPALESAMTPQQIAEGQKAASDFKLQ